MTVATASTFQQMSSLAYVARVRAVTCDGCRLYLEYRNGQIATVDSDKPFGFSVGSVLLVWQEEKRLPLHSSSLSGRLVIWLDHSWVARCWTGME